jgi:hypothetical protein
VLLLLRSERMLAATHMDFFSRCRNSGAEQSDVESSITMLTDYYMGIEPQGVGNWIMLDGTFIGNNTPSNSNPYNHW